MRVEAFMRELEIESHKLGIPCKTRHNEVAPNQFEVAPIYEEVNLANDHNLLLMNLMDVVARRHNFRVLLHENLSKVSTVRVSITTGRWVPIPAYNFLPPAKHRSQTCNSLLL